MTTTQRIAFLTAGEGIEEVELTEPWKAVTDAATPPSCSPLEEGEVQLFQHLDASTTQKVDRLVADASVGDYDALVLPGGVANPDALRTDEQAVAFVRDFVGSGRPSQPSATRPGRSSRPTPSAAAG